MLFYARLALLKIGLLNWNLTWKGLKIKVFLQKTQNFFFSETAVRSYKL